MVAFSAVPKLYGPNPTLPVIVVAEVPMLTFAPEVPTLVESAAKPAAWPRLKLSGEKARARREAVPAISSAATSSRPMGLSERCRILLHSLFWAIDDRCCLTREAGAASNAGGQFWSERTRYPRHAGRVLAL